MTSRWNRGVVAALLFGAGTPAAKLLVGGIDPWLLAGVLYLGSGIGLAMLRLAHRAQAPKLGSGVLWLAGAVVLSWPQAAEFGTLMPSLAVAGACLAWGIDNNLTRKVALADASYIAQVKGLAAGATNVALALAAGAALPGLGVTLIAGAVGFFSYGLSLVLFVIALRHLGTARTGAYFSIAMNTRRILRWKIGTRTGTGTNRSPTRTVITRMLITGIHTKKLGAAQARADLVWAGAWTDLDQTQSGQMIAHLTACA